jgi:hypothetical protein
MRLCQYPACHAALLSAGVHRSLQQRLSPAGGDLDGLRDSWRDGSIIHGPWGHSCAG